MNKPHRHNQNPVGAIRLLAPTVVYRNENRCKTEMEVGILIANF
ncbi:hypothetical protein [Okeania sp. SIO2B3]|nr:hypothetical protein [Okeania sp. SIO2B3]